MPSNGFIYCHTNKLNGKRYIGQTKRSVKKRWEGKEESYKTSSYFYSALKKYGWNGFEHEILAEVSIDELDDLEKFYISKYKTNDSDYGYNLQSGGNNNKTFAVSTIKKLSEAKKGHSTSQETKNKIRNKQKGQHHSIATEFKKGHKNNGWKWSEASRKKLSNSRKGMKFSKEHIEKLKLCHCKPVVQYDLNMNFIAEYVSTKEAARINNMDSTTISSCCNGKLKTSNHYIWKWKV